MASGPISFAEAATAGSWMAPGNIAWPIDATPWSGPYWDAAEYWTGPDMDMTDLFSRVSTVCHRIYLPHKPLFNVISDPLSSNSITTGCHRQTGEVMHTGLRVLVSGLSPRSHADGCVEYSGVFFFVFKFSEYPLLLRPDVIG